MTTSTPRYTKAQRAAAEAVVAFKNEGTEREWLAEPTLYRAAFYAPKSTEALEAIAVEAWLAYDRARRATWKGWSHAKFAVADQRRREWRGKRQALAARRLGAL